MDNTSFHKMAGVREAIGAGNCRLVYLPPYSPDLSPIELMWSKIKQGLRTATARTVAELIGVTGPALPAATSTTADARYTYKDNARIRTPQSRRATLASSAGLM